MRLIAENYAGSSSLASFEQVAVNAMTTLMHYEILPQWAQTADTNSSLQLFNFLVSPYTYQAENIQHISAGLETNTLLKFYDIQATFVTNLLNLQLIPVMANYMHTPLNVALNMQWNVITTFSILYSILILWHIGTKLLANTRAAPYRSVHNMHLFIFSWVFLSLDKVESTEEAITLIMLWPWCFLIIFTHLMGTADHSLLFGFSEWGLPVTYGLVMLAEHSWAMGTYLFVYIAGAAGRKYSLVTALEDAAALLILIARVLLQAVRGVIVGMFHFICREMLWNMSAYWTSNTVLNSSTASQAQQLAAARPIMQLLLDCIITGGSFVIITAIMFLQLLFLLVSVWLFCKCWFTSWRKC